LRDIGLFNRLIFETAIDFCHDFGCPNSLSLLHFTQNVSPSSVFYEYTDRPSPPTCQALVHSDTLTIHLVGCLVSPDLAVVCRYFDGAPS
jgi:hypothetical protein